MSAAPARIAGLQPPSLAKGAVANLCVVDPKAPLDGRRVRRCSRARSTRRGSGDEFETQGQAHRRRRPRRLGGPCLARDHRPRGRRRLPRRSARRAGRRGRRDRLQHEHGGLPGDRHRPVVLRAAHHVHVPDERELRRRPRARRVGQGARPRDHRPRAHQLPLQPRLAPDLAGLAGGARGAGRERRGHARPHAPHPRQGRAARRREHRDRRREAPAQGRPGAAQDGRPRPGQGRHVRRDATRRRRPKGRRRPTCTSSPTTSASSAPCCATSASAASASPSSPRRRAPARCSSTRRTASSSATAPATRPRSRTRSRPSSGCWARCPCSASASATSSSPRRSAARTFKLKFGHRGANHPVKDLRTGVIEITTQNHGFAVKDEAVPTAPRSRT